jgi:predicted metal-dependent phosphoesterase TrpH
LNTTKPVAAGNRPGRADLHIHSLASDGVSSVTEILEYAQNSARLDVIAITDHERVDAAHAARAIAEARAMHLEVIVGEEVTTRGGHVLALFINERIKPWGSLRSTIARIHEQGGLAVIAHPLVPYPLCASARSIRRLLDEQDAIFHPDGIEAFNPTTARMRWAKRAPAFIAELGVAAIGASDAHRAEHVGVALTTFDGSSADDVRRAIIDRSTAWEGSTHAWRTQFGTFRRQMGKNALAVRDEVRGKLLRDGTGRDLGYPGGRLRPARLDEPGLRREGATE